MGNILQLEDVKYLAGKRYDKGYYKRHRGMMYFFIASFAVMLIGMLLCLGADSKTDYAYPTVTYTNTEGDVINFDIAESSSLLSDTIYIGTTEYRKGDVNIGAVDQRNDTLYYAGLWVLFVGFIAIIIWFIIYYENCGKFKDKFLQNRIDKKEFIDPD